MTWWLGLLIIGVILAGIIVGLLVSFIIIKARKKEPSGFLKPQIQAANHTPIEPFHQITGSNAILTASSKVIENIPAHKQAPLPASDKPQGHTSHIENATANKNQVISKVSDALIELENNLVIANKPMTSKPLNFYTTVWSSRRSEFNVISHELMGELTEAYVDMFLANNIVWLVTELGRDSKELSESYLKLSSKIAECLQRIMPPIRECFR